MSPLARRGASTLAVLAGLLWFAMLRPASLGGPVTYLVIRGDSMEPTYHGGDLVLVRAAGPYSIGDIVAYRVPTGEIGAGHLVIHRITGGTGEAGYLLRGDNNASVDPWTPRASDVAGRSWIAIPAAGLVMATLRQPAFAGALAAAIVTAWLFARGAPRLGKQGRRRSSELIAS